ncbi:hypothetical protein [Amycolatopsis keratiniphila]|uniref:hypothetical protein n=1 Tax=Amycolatopsis keratiniphila TaxID=129921 RepID=UPI000879FE34|nr:hypothetical protein [Amycolatopsis keratiniphila]OLZ57067.1 hypothetical protein BS330_15370 [Amycolatopsis keratiniphila subsp. nogabecina]SDU47437.1 hypothetical protein SAMN04489733_4734 [Amycolatopsis keratiniphila]
MARKFGRRGKPAAGAGQEVDPRDLFGTAQPARQAARPASSTPLADQLNQGWPGVDPGYVVLPRSLAEGMSLPWQQQMAALLAQFHQENGRLAWPIYRVVPSRYEKLVDLDEEQLAEAGYLVEMDTEGEMIYRERSGRKVEDPANTTVLVSCLDPIPKPSQRQAPPPPSQAAPPATGQPPRAPAPMNIGPAPVWRTVTPPSGPPAPPLPGNHGAPQAPAPAPQAPASQAPAPQAPAPQPPVAQAPPTQPPVSQAPPPLPQPSRMQPPPVSAPPATPEVQPAAASQAEPEPPVSPPDPPVTAPPSVAMPASPPQGVPVAPEPATPPRGVPMHRGWFDELAENVPESSKVDQPEGGEFGPTGDPTEIPYRYRK